MADITATKPAGTSATDGVVVTTTAATTSDQEAAFVEGMYLLARNSGASSRTVTVYTAPSPDSGRTADIADSVAAGATALYGPFTARRWRQANGKLKFKATHAEVLFAAILPR